MPTIVYKGEEHVFPDGWSDEKIANALKAPAPAPPSAGADVLKSIPSGLAKGVAGLVGLPGDVGYALRAGNDWAKGKLGFERDPEYVASGEIKGGLPDVVPSMPTSQDARGAIEGVTGKLHEPQTRAGRYAGSVAEFIPGAVGPGNALRSFTRFAAAPGLAAEGAADAAREYAPGWEGTARTVGGLAGFGAASAMRNPQAGERAVSSALRDVPEPVIRQAEQLIRDAEMRGITLTWPEAIQQVTNSGTRMGELLRYTEASRGGDEVLRPVFAQRAGQVEQAMGRELGNIAAVPMQPSQIGPRASEAATGILDGIRQRINTRTAPDYRAAEADLVPDRTMARLHRAVPGFTDALAAVRGNPHLNDPIRGLPDNSVGVLNEVKKQLDQQAANTGRATDPNRNMQISASNERSASAVRRAGRRASSPYRRALDEQARAREAELLPEQRGIIGQISDSADTAAAGRALLPETPLPGSAAETGRATSRMAQQDLRTTQNLIRSRLEQAYQTAARDLQGGPSEFAGAAARKKIYGDRQLRRNVRAAISALPNGTQISAGFDRFMDVLQATGRRQPIGSKTEFNRQMTRDMEGGRILSEAFKPGAALRERVQQWRLGQNTGELARLFTNPDAARRLIELSRMRYGDPRLTGILGDLSTDLVEAGPLEVTINPRVENMPR